MSTYLSGIFKKITSPVSSAIPSASISSLQIDKNDPSRGCFKASRSVSIFRNTAPLEAKRLRSLKHPGILSHVHDDPEKDILLTEAVRPLDLDELRAFPEWAELVAFQAAGCVLFLAEQASMAHSGIALDAMFIDDCGQFKLGRFGESVCCSGDGDVGINCSFGALIAADAADALRFIVTDLHISNRGETLHQIVTSLSDSHRLVQLYSKLDTLSIDSDIDRMATIRAASAYLHQPLKVPPSIVFKVLLSLWTVSDPSNTASAFTLPLNMDSVRLVIDCIGRLVDCREYNIYNQRALEMLCKLLSVKRIDQVIRQYLLESVFSKTLLERLADDFIEATIYPFLCTSLQDSLAAVRDLALRDVFAIASRLPPSLLSSSLLSHLARLQDDPQPGIRTNVLIGLNECLEPLLPIDVRRKIIGPAYHRGLRDTFPAAKISSLNGLARSCGVCETDEIASKLMPTLCPLLIDSNKEIVDGAMRCLELLIQELKKRSSSSASIDSDDKRQTRPLIPETKSPNSEKVSNSSKAATTILQTPETVLSDSGGAASTSVNHSARGKRLGATRKIQ